MKKFISAFFRNNRAPAQSTTHLPSLSDPESFQASSDSRYRVTRAEKHLNIEILVPDLLAWTELQNFTADDFTLEMTLHMPGDRGASSGVIFRMTDESSFLCLLISSEGWLNVNLLLNGHPRALITHLECPWIKGRESIELKLIARSYQYLAFLDGQWAFELAEDSLRSGSFALAALSRSGKTSASYSGIGIHTDPAFVEAEYLMNSQAGPESHEQRRRLAMLHFSSGDYLPAVQNLRRLPGGDSEDLYLEGLCNLHLGLNDEAEALFRAVLSKTPNMEKARLELLNILYIQGRYLELKDLLIDDGGTETDAYRLNLLGHAYQNLGRLEDASAAYEKAAALDPDTPIYLLNNASTLDSMGEYGRSAPVWLEASLAFHAKEAWDDAEFCVQRLRELGWNPASLDSLEAGIAIGRGEVSLAESILSRLAKRNALDAPSAFALAGINAARGSRDEAIENYRLAVELEPEKPLYLLKLAEALFLAGRDYRAELDAAIKASQDEPGASGPWALNLAGQAALAEDRPEEATGFFRRALEMQPDSSDIAMNLSEALHRAGDTEAALNCLKGFRKPASILNHKGNLHVADGELEKAIEEYRLAIAESSQDDPGLYDYLCNLAATLIELDHWPEAGDCLRKALEMREGARALILMGDCSTQTGELARAEAAYTLALEKDSPGGNFYIAALKRLIDHYRMRLQTDKANARLDELALFSPEESEMLRKDIS